MTRPLAVILAASAVALAYAVARIRALGWDVDLTAVPAVAWAFLAGLLVRGKASHALGREHQRIVHAYKAVYKGHPR